MPRSAVVTTTSTLLLMNTASFVIWRLSRKRHIYLDRFPKTRGGEVPYAIECFQTDNGFEGKQQEKAAYPLRENN